MIGTDAPVFGRLITAMVTPFTDQGEIDEAALEKLVEHLIATGTDSIVVAGTTGESPTLTGPEKMHMLKLVISLVRKRIKVIMGTGYNSTATSIAATQEAEALGADGALVVAPYYNKPGQDGLLSHFSAIAQATTLPIIIYNVPGRTGINISAETTIELSKRYPNVCALKESTSDVDQAAQVASKASDHFRIYSGDDYLTLPFLSIGACGVVSVASHLVGCGIKLMMDKFLIGELDEVRSLHYHYLPLFKGLFAASNPTCIKYALSVLGLCKMHLRLPLVPLSVTQQKILQDVMDNTRLDRPVLAK